MPTFKARMLCIVLLLTLCAAGIVARLFYIQVLRNKEFAAESRKQAQQRVILVAKRGDLRDRRGRVLSTSVGSQLVLPAEMLGPQDLPADSARQRIALRRVYPFGDAAGAVLGYVGKDGSGLGGAEFFFDKQLRGENGWAIVMRDGRNRKYPTIDLPRKQPEPGADVYLTLDIDIQKIAENVVRQSVAALAAKGGMCIVMEPASGAILAMVNEPAFNPNMPARYALDARLNKCIGYTFEPGSTFKTVTAACALQEGVRKETDIIDGNQGVYEVYDEKIRDEKPYGRLTFSDALAYSSNVCFAKVANDIGNDRLYKYARDFGFGSQTGVQLPGEECGVVHPIEKWSGRTRVTMAIGQEVGVTLLQMSLLFAAIANGGVLVEPRIVGTVRAAGGTMLDSTAVKPVRRVVSREVAGRLTAILRTVVTKGTGVKAAIPGIAVAGKTGTAQKFDKEAGTYSNLLGWASFIGFAPAENPLLLCAVVIDEPQHGEMGGMAAAPAFQKIMSQIISHPQLEFAEKILGRPGADGAIEAEEGTPVPDLVGMPSEMAAAALKAENIPFEIVGGGKGKIAFQEPEGKNLLAPTRKLLLYTTVQDSAKPGRGDIAMPSCVGKDLREAVNAMNLKGLSPYVIGAGIVTRQGPIAGNLVHHAEACTLVCSFGAPAGKM
ncbi:MAG TPA: penicillin-binding transpeptidase domain-containing protein [Chitinivibrionales bacterium]|nr:penicillin-binding transpeptidase domain-containing protein [Chitinivibrionales bacterium]